MRPDFTGKGYFRMELDAGVLSTDSINSLIMIK